MKLLPDRLRWSDPVLYVITALLAAAVLVIYLQHRALGELDRQTNLILQKIAEQTAVSVADSLQETLNGPVFDTLTRVNHPFLQAGRIDLVAQEYAEGLRKYPQVERFFLWTAATDASTPREVLFFGGPAKAGSNRPATTEGPPARQFYRDPAFGRLVYDVADRHAESQQIYAAAERAVGKTPYEIFVRLFWVDARRDRYFALLGFVVNLDAVRTELFPGLYERGLRSLLEPADGSPKLQMRVLDERDRPVFAPSGEMPAVAGRARFALLFYPEEIGTRLAAGVDRRVWSVVVSPVARTRSSPTQGYWLSGLSVLLMLVALGFALQGNKRAWQLSRMQTDFVSHVSHELKTPLSLLSAVSETLALERARSPEKLAQYLDIVRSETTRLSALVDRILEFSRVENGRRTYELETIGLTPLVRETVEEFQRALRGQSRESARIEVEELGGSPQVAADPAALEQVLLNLLDNAVKYSDRITEITVRVGRVGSEAVIEVADRGVGIDSADLGRIFERFYRGSGAPLHRQGFGLGLAIARDVVAAHRGKIDVRSEPGRGSTFKVRLPALGGAPSPQRAEESAAAAAPSGVREPAGTRGG